MLPLTVTFHFFLMMLMNIDIYIIIASLKSDPMGKLLNRIPSLRLLISSLLGLV